ILSAAILALGQTTKTNSRPEQPNAAPKPTEELQPKNDATKYTYEFTQPQFFLRHILIEHDSTGRSKVTFERLNEEVPVVEAFEISAAAMARILGYYQSLQFLDSQTNYQSEKQFPHLGTMRLQMEQGARKRLVEFNWTNNREAAGLVNEYRRIADQANFVFDMSVARQNQPLNAPKLMEGLETLLKRDGVSDPQQLVPLLREISTDEHLPLIARNHALRLLKKIENGK
ncbi:MAG: hypothetical protein ACRD6N_15915, partial [Pyrinomonadaceae bacterium]